MRLVHSYSALKLYEQCGLRYYRQRIVKDVYEQDTTQITHGNTVHKAIENKVKHGIAIPKELSAYGNIINVVERSAQTAGKTIQVEQNFGIDRQYAPVSYWDKDQIWLRAKVDVLVSGGPEAALMDWKTGKRRVDFTQLKIAAIAIFKNSPLIQTINSSFVWLKDSVMDMAVYRRTNLPILIHEIEPRLTAIEEAAATGVFKPKPSYLCTYCPCKPTCPYATH